MPTIQHTTLRPFGYAIFEAAGVPADQARVVTDHLVESNLMGHDSHGVLHLAGYVRGLLSGGIKPVGGQQVIRETPVSLVIDANKSFGIALAYQAMQMAVDRAKQHTLGAVATAPVISVAWAPSRHWPQHKIVSAFSCSMAVAALPRPLAARGAACPPTPLPSVCRRSTARP